MRMNKKDKSGYTLAEIMIVMLILTVIFAAFAPFFTGRVKKTYKSKYNVWSWANYTGYDAFAAPSIASSSGELVFGASPNSGDDINTIFSPLSRIIIRSGNVTQAGLTQRQIQFRYGRTSSSGATPNGKFAGTWLVDGSNYLIGGGYKNIKESSSDKPTGNTAIGYNALNLVTKSTSNTAIGYDALSTMTTNDGRNVAVGYEAGKTLTTGKGRNTFVGAGAGKTTSLGYKNVAIGYNAMYNGSGAASGNSFIGYEAGYTASSGANNVGIGYYALRNLTSGNNNVAIGTQALLNLTTGSNNVAIGYNACAEVVKSSNKTCIGYNSGPHAGTTADFLNARGETIGDTAMRTYIGSRPYASNFGGDAVLEIHNIKKKNDGIPGVETSAFNITTVINGNLIVRGRPYFTVGKNLQHFYDVSGDNKMRVGAGIYSYGYKKPEDAQYALCSQTPQSYNFADKCITLKTVPKTSDRRLKNIEGKYTLGMDRLRKVNVYNYTFKNDKDKRPQVGVIAQELQKVFPTAVFQGEDGYLRIRWDEMFYAMINGIKEIDKRIVALVKRTTNVEAQISQLEKENTELKTQIDNLTVRVNKLKAQ